MSFHLFLSLQEWKKKKEVKKEGRQRDVWWSLSALVTKDNCLCPRRWEGHLKGGKSNLACIQIYVEQVLMTLTSTQTCHLGSFLPTFILPTNIWRSNVCVKNLRCRRWTLCQAHRAVTKFRLIKPVSRMNQIRTPSTRDTRPHHSSSRSHRCLTFSENKLILGDLIPLVLPTSEEHHAVAECQAAA